LIYQPFTMERYELQPLWISGTESDLGLKINDMRRERKLKSINSYEFGF